MSFNVFNTTLGSDTFPPSRGRPWGGGLPYIYTYICVHKYTHIQMSKSGVCALSSLEDWRLIKKTKYSLKWQQLCIDKRGICLHVCFAHSSRLGVDEVHCFEDFV